MNVVYDNLPLLIVLAIEHAVANGAKVLGVHSMKLTNPGVVLDVTELGQEILSRLDAAGFRYTTPGDVEDDAVLLAWYKHDGWHPHDCDCLDCQDTCCCGGLYRHHGGEEHPFVSAYWYARGA